MTAYLIKPVKHSELLEAIRMALGMEARRASGERVPASPPLEPGRSLRVLLAEDNVVNQTLAIRLLEKRGHQVMLATNGQEAVQQLDPSVDVILMDVQMPVLNGLDATRAIRQQERSTGQHVPIVALTACAMKGDSDRCLEAGMDFYLAKPIKPNELEQVLSQVDSLIRKQQVSCN